MFIKIYNFLRFQVNIWKIKITLFRRSRNLDSTNYLNDSFIDPFVDKYAKNISDYYKKYKHVITFENEGNKKFVNLAEKITWCRKNCTDVWRVDLHRVISHAKINEATNLIENHYIFNDMKGELVTCFAFNSDKDFSWFQLRWL